MGINSKQLAQQQLAQRQTQPQPTMNQPGANVPPNATMATSGISPIIGGMNAQTNAPSPFPVGADFFERMQDIKDMSDNQILVGMQQGAITPMEGLIEMQTRKEARSRYQQQVMAEQAGKKSVVEQVTEEFVASGNTNQGQQGIMDTTALAQASSPVKAYENGGIVKYQNRGYVDTSNPYMVPFTQRKRIEELDERIEDTGDLMSTGIPKEYLYYDTKARDYAQSQGADETTRNTFAGMLAAETGKDIDVITGDRVGSVGEIGAFQLRPEYFGEGKSPGFGASGNLSMDAMKNFDQNAAQAFDYYTGLRENLKESFPDLDIDFNRAAVAAYNAGPGKVKALLRDKKENYEQFLPEGTKNHLKKVFSEVPQSATKKLTGEQLKEKLKKSGAPSKEVKGVETRSDLMQMYDKKMDQVYDKEQAEIVESKDLKQNILPEDKVTNYFDKQLSKVTGEPTGENEFRTTGVKIDPKDASIAALNARDFTVAGANSIDLTHNAVANAPNIVDEALKVNYVEGAKDGKGGKGKQDTSVSGMLKTAKDIAGQLYDDKGVDIAVNAVKDTIAKVFKSQKEFNRHTTIDGILRSAAAMYNAPNFVAGVIDSLGLFSQAKAEILKNDQTINGQVLQLNTAMGNLISTKAKTQADLTSKIFGDVVNNTAEQNKNKLELVKMENEVKFKYLEQKVELVKDDNFINSFKEVFNAFIGDRKSIMIDLPDGMGGTKKQEIDLTSTKGKLFLADLQGQMQSNYADAVLNKKADMFMANLPDLGGENQKTLLSLFSDFVVKELNRMQGKEVNQDELKTPPSDSDIEKVEKELSNQTNISNPYMTAFE